MMSRCTMHFVDHGSKNCLILSAFLFPGIEIYPLLMLAVNGVLIAIVDCEHEHVNAE